MVTVIQNAVEQAKSANQGKLNAMCAIGVFGRDSLTDVYPFTNSWCPGRHSPFRFPSNYWLEVSA